MLMRGSLKIGNAYIVFPPSKHFVGTYVLALMNRRDVNPHPRLLKAVWMRCRTPAQAVGPGPLVALCQAAAQRQTSPGRSPLCKSRPVGVMQNVWRRNIRCNVCVLLYWEKLILAVSLKVCIS